jgi:hypothetical protein
MRSRPTRLAASLALGIALTLSDQGPSPADQSSATPRLTPPVHATKGDIAPSRTFTSPYLAVDPEDPNTIVAAYVELRSARCSLMRSRDGGRSWRVLLDSSPSLPTHPSCLQTESGGPTQSPIAFGRDHTLYYALAGFDPGQDGRGNSVLLGRSTDLGDTWTTTIIRNSQGTVGPDVEANRPLAAIAVDRRTGPEDIVYVGWLRYYPNYVPRRIPQSQLAVSTDGGRTFAEPVSVVGSYFASEAARRAAAVIEGQPANPSNTAPPTPPDTLTAANFSGGFPKLALDDNGTLYAAWFSIAMNVVPPPWRGLYLSRSTDQGKTFTVTPVLPGHSSQDNPILQWSREGGPQGSLHLVYESKIPTNQGDRDITYRRSTDGGATWTEPKILNDDDPKLLAGQYIPNLSVAPDGRLDAVWWDFRDDPGMGFNDVYLTSSSDNGTTWTPNVRITDRSIDRKFGPWGNGFDMRQPPGVLGMEAYTVVAWDDTRNGTPEAEAQDIYTTLVQWRDLPPARSPVLVYVLAGVCGLLLGGLVLTVAAVRIRRSPKSSSIRERVDKAPVQVG